MFPQSSQTTLLLTLFLMASSYTSCCSTHYGQCGCCSPQEWGVSKFVFNTDGSQVGRHYPIVDDGLTFSFDVYPSPQTFYDWSNFSYPTEGFPDLNCTDFIRAAGRVTRRKLIWLEINPYPWALLECGVYKDLILPALSNHVLGDAMEYTGVVGGILLDEITYIYKWIEEGMGWSIGQVEEMIWVVDNCVDVVMEELLNNMARITDVDVEMTKLKGCWVGLYLVLFRPALGTLWKLWWKLCQVVGCRSDTFLISSTVHSQADSQCIGIEWLLPC